MRRGLLLFTLGIVVAVGVAVGLLESPWWGAASAAIAAVVLGATARATLRNYD
jgi:hypothetical protein